MLKMKPKLYDLYIFFFFPGFEFKPIVNEINEVFVIRISQLRRFCHFNSNMFSQWPSSKANYSKLYYSKANKN